MFFAIGLPLPRRCAVRAADSEALREKPAFAAWSRKAPPRKRAGMADDANALAPGWRADAAMASTAQPSAEAAAERRARAEVPPQGQSLAFGSPPAEPALERNHSAESLDDPLHDPPQPELFFTALYRGIEAIQSDEFKELLTPRASSISVDDFPPFLKAVPPVVTSLVPMLDARSFQSMRQTCVAMHQATVTLVPSMPRTTLKEHQKQSLAWMERRESAVAGPFDDAWLWDPIASETLLDSADSADGGAAKRLRRGNSSVRHVLTGQIVDDYEATAPAMRKKTRGGVLCDEPGTGKTATTLALILRTRGLLPLPPPPPVKATPERRSTPYRRWRESAVARRLDKPRVAVTLVIVPANLLAQWSAMVDKHAPALSKHVVDTKADLPDLASWAAPKPDVVIVPSSLVSTEHVEVFDEDGSWFHRYRFLRLVVDEGHNMANNSQLRALLERVSRERTWLVTGTPSKTTSVADALNRLRDVLVFLSALDSSDEAWRKLIAGPLRASPPGSPPYQAGVQRLERVLATFLLRHSTAGIFKFAVHRAMSLVRMSLHDVEQYNIIATQVRLNNVLVRINNVGKHLAVGADKRRAEEALFNVRLALGHLWSDEGFYLTLSGANLLATRKLMESEPLEARERMEAFIRRVERTELAPCPVCSKRLLAHLVFPCGHTLCPFCFDPALEVKCPTCLASFDGNKFAWLQPGFELHRKVSASATTGGAFALVNGHAKALVRTGAHYLDVVGCKARHVCERIANLSVADDGFKCIVFSQDRAVADHIGDAIMRVLGVDAVASMWNKARREAERDLFTTDTVKEWKCDVCHMINIDVAKTNCDQAFIKVLDGGQHRTLNVFEVAPQNAKMGTTVRILAEHRNATVLAATRRCKGRRSTANTVTRHVKCPVLLLSKDASHGLNLPLVRHLFLVDPIRDVALEQQIIARAARLGNTTGVTVEYVLVPGSFEVDKTAPAGPSVLDKLQLMEVAME